MRSIVEPLLPGLPLGDVPEDDIRLVQDLGLLRMGTTGGLEVANPIYRQVIPRMLASTPLASLPHIPTTSLDSRERLDPERLMEAFMAFWRQHGEPLMGAAPYPEVVPHLVLLAFLQRVANGGGTLERDYAIGTGRMDIGDGASGARGGAEAVHPAELPERPRAIRRPLPFASGMRWLNLSRRYCPICLHMNRPQPPLICVIVALLEAGLWTLKRTLAVADRTFNTKGA